MAVAAYELLEKMARDDRHQYDPDLSDESDPEIQIDRSGLYEDKDISELLESFTEHIPSAVPVRDKIHIQDVDESVIRYCEERGIESVEPFKKSCQTGGMSRSYLGYSLVPDAHAPYGQRLVEYFIKASLSGDPNIFYEEGKIHAQIAMQTEAVPDVYHIDTIEMGETEDGKKILLPVTVMDMVHGELLDDYVETRGANRTEGLTRIEKLNLFKQYVDHVAEIHEAGYVHRDIKPSNAIVKDGKVAKVLDMGIASRIGEPPKNDIIFYSPDYVSPEHLEHKVDPRMDIYSLGCILYELLTGKPPYNHVVEMLDSRDKESDDITPERIQETFAKRMYHAMIKEEHEAHHSADVRESYGRLSEDLAFIVGTCLKKDPDERFDSCRALSNALNNVIEEELLADEVLRTLEKSDKPGGYLPGKECFTTPDREDEELVYHLVDVFSKDDEEPEQERKSYIDVHRARRKPDSRSRGCRKRKDTPSQR